MSMSATNGRNCCDSWESSLIELAKFAGDKDKYS